MNFTDLGFLHVKLITFGNNASIEHEQLVQIAKVFLTGYG